MQVPYVWAWIAIDNNDTLSKIRSDDILEFLFEFEASNPTTNREDKKRTFIDISGVRELWFLELSS